MKVLMLGWELPPHYVGGMGMVCDQLTRYMAHEGADIEFILPFTADFSHIKHMKVRPASAQDAKSFLASGGTYDSKFYEETTVTAGVFPTRTLYEQVHAFEKNVQSMVKLGSYDVIHAHDWLTLKAAIAAKKATGLPLFVHIHATEFDRSGGNSGNSLIHEIEYMGMMVADRVIAVSEFTKQLIVEKYQIPADKIEVVHNSVDVDSYAADEGENFYKYLAEMKAYGWRVVSNIGRLTMQKGLTGLVRAMQKVVAIRPKTLLMVVGSGDQYQELIELAAACGISRNVLFVDFQRGKKLRDAFAVSDLFVMPSVSEPFGIAPLEAIAFGTPVMVSRQSGVSEVIRNCLKVDFWDIDQMANQIVAVVQNDVLRDELHRQSYAEFEKMSWGHAARRLKNLYEIEVGASV